MLWPQHRAAEEKRIKEEAINLAVNIYLFYTIAVFAYSIYREISLFKTGRYDPNPFKNRNNGIYEKYSFFITLPIIVGSIFLFKERSELLVLLTIFVGYTAILMGCTNVLNYLTYRKSREKKIIKDTLLFNAVIGTATFVIWKCLT